MFFATKVYFTRCISNILNERRHDIYDTVWIHYTTIHITLIIVFPLIDETGECKAILKSIQNPITYVSSISYYRIKWSFLVWGFEGIGVRIRRLDSNFLFLCHLRFLMCRKILFQKMLWLKMLSHPIHFLTILAVVQFDSCMNKSFV